MPRAREISTAKALRWGLGEEELELVRDAVGGGHGGVGVGRGTFCPSLPRKQWRNGTRVLGCLFGPSQIQPDRIGLGRNCALLACCNNCKQAWVRNPINPVRRSQVVLGHRIVSSELI